MPPLRVETQGYVTQRWVVAREDDYKNYGLAVNGLVEALELEQEASRGCQEGQNHGVNELITELGF